MSHCAQPVPSVFWHVTCLGDELVMIGQVCSAVDAAVRSVTVRQIRLESFGLCHLHHLSRVLLTQLRAGSGRTAALLASLTKETLENARKSRCCPGGRVALSTQLGQEKNGTCQPIRQSGGLQRERTCEGGTCGKNMQRVAGLEVKRYFSFFFGNRVSFCHQAGVQWHDLSSLQPPPPGFK